MEELYEAFVRKQDESRWTYLPYGPFENFSDFQKWVHQFALEREPLFYLIFSNQTQKPLGLASYTRIDQENRVIEIGHLHFFFRASTANSSYRSHVSDDGPCF